MGSNDRPSALCPSAHPIDIFAPPALPASPGGFREPAHAGRMTMMKDGPGERLAGSGQLFRERSLGGWDA